jgi:catechol 2,3-dioxygenase-like lactoylglutathione lyase family enzyme
VNAQIRIARPVSNLERAEAMYGEGLGLDVLGRFENHQGFDGVILGSAGLDYHFEFTFCRTHPVPPTPTGEDLVVFYLSDAEAWQAACVRMIDAGFRQVRSFNPYWDSHGRTFEDADGYRVVLQNADWKR